MQLIDKTRSSLAVFQLRVSQRSRLIQQAALVLILLLVAFLALYNLTGYPTTWFDEGSHLHVPKTLVRFGVYADYSSEGFRYYGPTIGVGPTVMLPIAAVFQLFGIGLLQARLVMAAYLLATIGVFYGLAHLLGGRRLAIVATGLLVTSRGVGLVLYGRQVLGEVPGMFFLVAGFWLWFAGWERPNWKRLVAVGMLLGLSMITKYQYLLFLGPTLVLAWLANLVYYRRVPQRMFLVPGIVAATCFGLWQLYMVFYLGPGTAVENLASLRQFTGGAALALSPRLMQESIKVLMSVPNYLGSLLPALAYGFFLMIPRRREAQLWGVVFTLVAVNLAWYVVASIGWWRYAFLGLAMASLFVARFFHDLTDGFRLTSQVSGEERQEPQAGVPHRALRWAMLAWLAVIFLIPLGETMVEVIFPGPNAPQSMATYMDDHVPTDVVIETWEPEMGFLTDHNYHFPPALLLLTAVEQVHLGGPPAADSYDFVQSESPEYVLVGDFARSVNLYSSDQLSTNYDLVTTIGGYELYTRKK